MTSIIKFLLKLIAIIILLNVLLFLIATCC